MPPAKGVPRWAIRMLVEADQLLEAANSLADPLSELESLQRLDHKTIAVRASNAIKRIRKAQKLIDEVKLKSLLQAKEEEDGGRDG